MASVSNVRRSAGFINPFLSKAWCSEFIPFAGAVQVAFRCVYTPHYSCPIPPAENRLQVPIRAGEKDFRIPLWNHKCALCLEEGLLK
jgi:hypothetical protein